MKVYLYRHFDRRGRLLYIGISLSAILRLVQHRRSARWCEEIAAVTIEPFADRASATTAEALAIKTEHPLYNKVGRSGGLPAKGLLTIKEAAASLRGGWRALSLRDAIKSGELRTVKSGRAKMIDAADLEAWDVARRCEEVRSIVEGAPEGPDPSLIAFVRADRIALPRFRKRGRSYYYDTTTKPRRLSGRT